MVRRQLNGADGALVEVSGDLYQYHYSVIPRCFRHGDIHAYHHVMLLPGIRSQAVSSFKYPTSYVQAIMEKTAGMPLYIEKMVEFLDLQRIEGADTGLDCQRGYGPGFGSRTGGPVDLMLHNISLQQVCRGQQGGMHVCAPSE